MFLQLHKIISTINYEQKWLQKVIADNEIDAVISDNRFGLYTHKIPCIFITHQLLVKTGNRITEMIGQKINNYFIQKYTQCWVPDAKEAGLAGLLSHPKKIPDNVRYIGPLSRFEKTEEKSNKYDLLVSISGPEPQRSIFEKMFLLQLKDFKGITLVVRGLPGETNIAEGKQANVTIVNHLTATELNEAFAQSQLVIARSGYTTVMDLVKMKKHAILIPTPGQTEQEYLAHYLLKEKYFYTLPQQAFSLKSALDAVDQFEFKKPQINTQQFKIAIIEFVGSLKSGNFAAQ